MNWDPNLGQDTSASHHAWATDEFFAAYDAVLAKWPVAVDSLDVPSVFGTTRVHVCGPDDGSPLVLLAGGGATSTVWFANVESLSRTHRVYAVDRIGDAGRSVNDGQPIRRLDDLMTWLDALLADLGLNRVALCGHSYGGWLALNYALHAPLHRVSRLALLDPTDCFAGLALNYRLHAVPLMLRPGPAAVRAFLDWETGGAKLDPDWLRLTCLATDPRHTAVVVPRRPPQSRLRAARVPTLVLLAERSRAHDAARVAEAVRRTMPHATVTVLSGATHHTVPTVDPAELNRTLVDFF